MLGLCLLLLASFHPSLQQDGGGKELSELRADAERRLSAALGPQVDESVVKGPLKGLAELEAAGREDLARVAAFPGGGDRARAKEDSHRFWADKMERLIQPYIDNPKELSELRADAERRLSAALGPQVDESVVKGPLKGLAELEAAGREDLARVAAFPGGGDRARAKEDSHRFWADKMERLIQPYIDNPKNFQLMVIDFVHMSEDPTFNNTDAYRKLEKDINEMCEEVFQKLRDEMEQRDKPAARLEDVTQNSWKRLEARRALEDAIFSISLTRQQAKLDAAEGSSSYLQWLPETIERASTSFRDRLNEIYK